ncbi:hypothetical protein B0T10DRAFT_493827 [Thelonectria olida]|uniref:ADP-ribose 1''-phosphate phosphatase n=1 Tax=Thelonectria olida TaxID=1576542 RepID=A0A9P9APA7_9HYPO|nr:hypothetical protein B0T10DRAFT_493827 [Thelonectria olida]
MATQLFTLGQTPLNSIRTLPSSSYLVHATNCIAQWGAGIAAELAEVFPHACKEYKKFCSDAKPGSSTRWPPESLTGQCLIIPPQSADVAAGAPSVFIVCLFTSYGFGRPNDRTGKPGKDPKSKILSQTRTSLKEFRLQLESNPNDKVQSEIVIYSPMFNSGAFKVPWGETASLIEDAFCGWSGRWLVMEPPSTP